MDIRDQCVASSFSDAASACEKSQTTDQDNENEPWDHQSEDGNARPPEKVA